MNPAYEITRLQKLIDTKDLDVGLKIAYLKEKIEWIRLLPSPADNMDKKLDMCESPCWFQLLQCFDMAQVVSVAGLTFSSLISTPRGGDIVLKKE